MTAAKAVGRGRQAAQVHAGAIDLPQRWSVQRKTELRLRLLRGEALDAVSRESQIPANELDSSKRVFLENGTSGLKSRSDPDERKVALARAKSDAEIVEAIRAVLAATPFHGEGHRKVRARLAHRGLAVGGRCCA
jgi:hypothetical protein